jgi:hypothetical protein
MKTFVMMAAIVVMARVAAGGGRPVLGGSEAPRATDLLRAQKLAEQAEKRRTLPARRGPGWRRGGSGWDDGGRARAETSESVVINVGPRKAPSRRAQP